MTDTPPPPQAPPSDDALVSHIVQQVGAHLRRTGGKDAQVIIASAIGAALKQERARCANLLRQAAQQADAESHKAAKGGRGQLAARLAVAHQVSLRLAAEVEKPPGGEVCGACRGTKRVASSIVLAGGQRAVVACPACSAPALDGPPAADQRVPEVQP